MASVSGALGRKQVGAINDLFEVSSTAIDFEYVLTVENVCIDFAVSPLDIVNVTKGNAMRSYSQTM